MPDMRARRAHRGARPITFAWVREFRLLMTGSYVSMLGSRVTTIACPLLALYLTNSPITAGVVAFAATVPSVLAYLPAGALVDHWDPRRTLLISESCRGGVIAMLTALLAIGRLTIALLVALVFVEEILEVFSILADQRCIRSLIPRDQASSVQASIETRANAVVLAGRPLGAFLFGLGPILPFLADAASFVVSVIMIAPLTSRREAPVNRRSFSVQQQMERLRTDIGQGWQWLLSDRYARTAMTLSAAATLIGQALIMVFLAKAHRSGFSPVMVGVVLAASGGGGVAGAMIASRWPLRPKLSLILVQFGAWVLAFALLLATNQQSSLWLVIVMAVLSIMSLTGAFGNIEVGTHLILTVDEDMLARATSISRLMVFSAYAVGPPLGGILAQVYGPPHAVLALFLITATFAVLALCSPSMRDYPREVKPAGGVVLPAG